MHVVLGRLGVTDQMKEIGTEESHRGRSQRQPSDETQIDRPLAQVHGGSDGTHHDRCHQVARDGCGGFHGEQEDQHGCHECTPASTSHPNQEPDDGASQDDVGIHVSRASVSNCWRRHPEPLRSQPRDALVKSLLSRVDQRTLAMRSELWGPSCNVTCGLPPYGPRSSTLSSSRRCSARARTRTHASTSSAYPPFAWTSDHRRDAARQRPHPRAELGRYDDQLLLRSTRCWSRGCRLGV